MNGTKVTNYMQLYGAFFIYSFVSVFAKLASQQSNIYMTILFIGIEIVILGIYAIVWQQALKKFDLVVALSSKGVTVIISLIWAVLIFQEKITINNLIGSALIVVGVWLVSADE